MTKVLGLFLAVLGLAACGTVGSTASPAPSPSALPSQAITAPQPSAESESVLNITVGDQTLTATFVDNPAAEEFRALLDQGPVTVTMEDYGGFEKVGPLGTPLTRSDEPITTQPGDIILYQGDQITIYYDTNTWTFTRLARIDDPSGLRELLGDGTVQVTFSLA